MSHYKVSFQLSEQELEILHDALYSYSKTGLDGDAGTYVSEDVERFYEKISGLYLEESIEDPAIEAFVKQYGIDAVLNEPEKLHKFKEGFDVTEQEVSQ
jgi:hypothetical protein